MTPSAPYPQAGWEGRARLRVLRCATAVEETRATVTGWLRARREDQRFRRVVPHFVPLERVLLGMLDRLNAELPDPRDPGRCYERCRWLDNRLAMVNRLFSWYATKYDQRLPTSPRADLLRAADEVTRSCWQEANRLVTTVPVTGPLCFVDGDTDGHSVRRCTVPREFRVADNDELAAFVAELPVPVVALPAAVSRNAWWLVVAAHETGHHVQHDLGLVTSTVEAVLDAAPPAHASAWSGWSGEVFADVYATLMTGEAAGWVVEELQFGTREHLLRPVGPYPAPVVRSALFGEVLRAVGAPDDVFGTANAARWLTGQEGSLAEQARSHVAAVPDIVAAVLALTIGGRELRSLADHDVLFNADRLADWAARLGRDKPVFTPSDTRTAPRMLLAAAVRGYRTGPTDTEVFQRNLVSALAASGEPGTLDRPAVPDIDDLTDRLVSRLINGGPGE